MSPSIPEKMRVGILSYLRKKTMHGQLQVCGMLWGRANMIETYLNEWNRLVNRIEGNTTSSV